MFAAFDGVSPKRIAPIDHDIIGFEVRQESSDPEYQAFKKRFDRAIPVNRFTDPHLFDRETGRPLSEKARKRPVTVTNEGQEEILIRMRKSAVVVALLLAAAMMLDDVKS